MLLAIADGCRFFVSLQWREPADAMRRTITVSVSGVTYIRTLIKPIKYFSLVLCGSIHKPEVSYPIFSSSEITLYSTSLRCFS